MRASPSCRPSGPGPSRRGPGCAARLRGSGAPSTGSRGARAPCMPGSSRRCPPTTRRRSVRQTSSDSWIGYGMPLGMRRSSTSRIRGTRARRDRRVAWAARPRSLQAPKAAPRPSTAASAGSCSHGRQRRGAAQGWSHHPVQVEPVDGEEPGGHPRQRARVTLDRVAQEDQEGQEELARRPGSRGPTPSRGPSGSGTSSPGPGCRRSR